MSDSRGVTDWNVFHHQVRCLIVKIGANSIEEFIITPNGVYVFGYTGGVGKVTSPDITVRKGIPPEGKVGNRWDVYEQTYMAKIETLDKEIHLGNIMLPAPSIFKDAQKNIKIVWGKEQELVASLTPQIVQRILKSRSITTDADPVNLNLNRCKQTSKNGRNK